MKFGKSIGFLLLAVMLFGTSDLFAQLQFDTSMVTYASPKEQELLNNVKSLSKKDLLHLLFIADNPFVKEYQVTKTLEEFQQIAQSYNTRKYQKGNRVKAAASIYESLFKRYYQQHDPTADLADITDKGRTTLGSFLVLVAYVYDELNIGYRFYTDAYGFHASLYPEQEDEHMKLGDYDPTSSQQTMILNQFLNEFVSQGNLDKPFTKDSMQANTMAKKGGFWSKMIYMQYMYTAAEQVEKGVIENAFNSYLKAYRVIPTTPAYIQLYSCSIIEISLKTDLSDFESSKEKWVFLVNNYTSVADNNLAILYDQESLDEINRTKQLSQSKKRFDYLKASITDQAVLKELNFAYYSGLAYYRTYEAHSRDYIKPYQLAKETYPDHIRLKEMAFNGMYNYLQNITSTNLYDSLKVFVELLPEIKEHPRYQETVFRACLIKCYYLLETSKTTELAPYYTELKNMGCPSDPSLEPMTGRFFAEYSAYYVRKNSLSTGRSILLDGIKLYKACELNDDMLQERYKFIKDVKSLH